MGKSSAVDLRVRIVGEIERGQSCRAAARQGRPAGSGLLAAHVEALVGWVEADGDITMRELAAQLLATRGVKAHPG